MIQPTTTPARPVTIPADQAVLFGLLLFMDSFYFIFARLATRYMPPPASSFYVMTVGMLEVGLYAWWTGQLRWRSFWQNRWFFLPIGFLIALSTATGYLSMSYIDPGTASLLSKMTTLFSVCFGLLWLGEYLNTWQRWGAILAVIGALTIAFQPGDYLRWGALISLFGALIYALHAVIVKQFGNKFTLVEFFFWRLFATSFFLMSFTLSVQSWVWPDANNWWVFLLIGTLDITLSRTLYYATLRKLPMSIHAILLTLSPVATILWTFLLFNTTPTSQQLLGGILVLFGVGLVTVKK